MTHKKSSTEFIQSHAFWHSTAFSQAWGERGQENRALTVFEVTVSTLEFTALALLTSVTPSLSRLWLVVTILPRKACVQVRAPRKLDSLPVQRSGLRDCAQVSSILFFHTFLGFSPTSRALRSRLTLPLHSRLWPHVLACIWLLRGPEPHCLASVQTCPPVPLPSHSADPALPLAVPRPHLDVEGVNFIYECNFQAAEDTPLAFSLWETELYIFLNHGN